MGGNGTTELRRKACKWEDIGRSVRRVPRSDGKKDWEGENAKEVHKSPGMRSAGGGMKGEQRVKVLPMRVHPTSSSLIRTSSWDVLLLSMQLWQCPLFSCSNLFSFRLSFNLPVEFS